MAEFLRGLLMRLGITKDTYIPPMKTLHVLKPKNPIVIIQPPKDTIPWKGVVIHHTKSSDGVVRDADAIAAYHTSYRVDYVMVSKEEFNRRKAAGEGHKFEKPWSAVGYHFLIERIGKGIKLVEGRPLNKVGAHAAYGGDSRFNKTHIGLAVIGDFDKEPPEKTEWEFVLSVVRGLMAAYGFDRNQVIGHREVYAYFKVPPEKSCPGALWSMEQMRKEL